MQTSRRWLRLWASKALNVTVLSALIGGCASVPPKPYHTLPLDAKTRQREQSYDRHYVDYGFWRGYEVGGYPLQADSYHAVGDMENYFKQSGAPDSARQIHGANMLLWLQRCIVYPAVIVGFGDLISGNPPSERPTVNVILLTALVADLFLAYRTEAHFAMPAANSFNSYIKGDLGLPDDYQPGTPR